MKDEFAYAYRVTTLWGIESLLFIFVGEPIGSCVPHTIRGVQYMHCVMHKCITVKAGGETKNTESMQKTCEFYEIRGKFVKAGGNQKNFRNRGKCTETAKLRGKFVLDD